MQLQSEYTTSTATSSSTNVYGCYVQGNTDVLTFNSDATSTQDSKAVQRLLCAVCPGVQPVYTRCSACKYECDTGSYYTGGVCDGTGLTDESCSLCNATIDYCAECDLETECLVRAMLVCLPTCLRDARSDPTKQRKHN